MVNSVSNSIAVFTMEIHRKPNSCENLSKLLEIRERLWYDKLNANMISWADYRQRIPG